MRIPNDIKNRPAKLKLINSATATEVAAMQRNVDLHHATKRLEGLSDLSLLAAQKHQNIFTTGDIAIIALGASLPIGRTEANPHARADAGLAHEHIQFGNGSFDPLLELYYLLPMQKDIHIALSTTSRLPFYENIKGFQGSSEITASFSMGYTPTENLSLHAGWSSFYQGYAYWDNEKDVNSGLIVHGITTGASYNIGKQATLGLAIRFPTSQSTLSNKGDTYKQGIIIQLGTSFGF